MPTQHRRNKEVPIAGRVWIELRIICASLLNWRSCLLANIALLLGISYLFVPIDLIPDRLPIIGHLDELGFLLAGFVGSRSLIPTAVIEQVWVDDESSAIPTSSPNRWQHLQFIFRILQADVSNFFLLQYRHADGFLITGKNSGTHWLKFMLSCALAEQYGTPPPARSSGPAADAIISHPRWAARYPELPRLGSSHTIPSIAFAWPYLARLLRHPPVVVLVRDIEAAMRSNYLKWQHRYAVTPSDYMRGDPLGRKFIADIWWYIHFFNRWGDLADARPHAILVVRYEDLQAAPAFWLARITEHYGIHLSEHAIQAGLRYAHRDSIRARLDPAATEIVVPPDDASRAVMFGPLDKAFMVNTMARYLRHDFGYDPRPVCQPAIACSNTPV